jgi:probable HAF family extracellular repeat protein
LGKARGTRLFFWSASPFICNGKIVPGGSTCDLAALGTDTLSEALGVNDLGQMVGVSIQSNHAFIWQNGKMTDLNSMVAPGTTLVLTDAQEINDLGEITGIAFDPSTNTSVAFLAVPIG